MNANPKRKISAEASVTPELEPRAVETGNKKSQTDSKSKTSQATTVVDYRREGNS